MFQNRSGAGYKSMGTPQEHTSADIQVSRVGASKVRNRKTFTLTWAID